MPGPIMTAKQAAKIYGSKYSIREVGNVVMLKNSDGRTVQVQKSQKVYHRTKGKFGIYTTAADIKRRSGGAGKSKKPVGTGVYRHTDDRKAKPKKRIAVKQKPTKKVSAPKKKLTGVSKLAGQIYIDKGSGDIIMMYGQGNWHRRVITNIKGTKMFTDIINSYGTKEGAMKRKRLALAISRSI